MLHVHQDSEIRTYTINGVGIFSSTVKDGILLNICVFIMIVFLLDVHMQLGGKHITAS